MRRRIELDARLRHRLGGGVPGVGHLLTVDVEPGPAAAEAALLDEEVVHAGLLRRVGARPPNGLGWRRHQGGEVHARGVGEDGGEVEGLAQVHEGVGTDGRWLALELHPAEHLRPDPRLARGRCERRGPGRLLQARDSRVVRDAFHSEALRDPIEEADGVDGQHRRAAARDYRRRMGVGADHGHAVEVGGEGKGTAFVLQQHHALERRLERHRPPGGVLTLDGGIELRPVEPPEPHLRPQQSAHLVIDGGFAEPTGLDERPERVRVHVGRARHLQVQPGRRGGERVVGGAPVGHEHPVEAPFALEHILVQPVVLRHPLAVRQVVRRHDRADPGLRHGGLVGRQVDLAERPLVDPGVGGVPAELRVVGHVVLDRRG